MVSSYLYIGIAIIIIIIIIGYYFYNSYEGLTNVPEKTNTPMEILLFKASWCPHCVNLQPTWEQIKNDYDGRIINNHKISFTTYDCSDNNPQVDAICKQYNVSGFPTIKALIASNVISLNENPTHDNLSSFIEDTASNN